VYVTILVLNSQKSQGFTVEVPIGRVVRGSVCIAEFCVGGCNAVDGAQPTNQRRPLLSFLVWNSKAKKISGLNE
jgi:hypothetical protein